MNRTCKILKAIARPDRALLATVFLGISINAGFSAQTIVGRWAPNPRECTPLTGMVEIGPLSLTEDNLNCIFDTVSRSGNTVFWRGLCQSINSVQRSTVIADLRGNLLSITINGAPNGNYERCLRR